MEKYNGFKAQKAAGSRAKLPAGGYVIKILNAEELSYKWGSVIEISFDIAEGEYANFFAKDYNNNDREDKKWRGRFRLNLPKGDGSEKDGWTKRSFEHSIWALEASNPGYHFDWDESKFIKKQVGVLFRDKEWAYNGRSGWTTEACRLEAVEDIRSGNFSHPKMKPLANKVDDNPVDWDAPPMRSDEDAPF